MRIFLLISFLVPAFTWTFGQKIPKKLKPHLEENSEVLAIGENYSLEKMHDSSFLFKSYSKNKKELLLEAYFLDSQCKVPHGKYIKKSEQKVKIKYGEYVYGVKHGMWIENLYERGLYNRGKRHGNWNTYFHSGNVHKSYKYQDGELVDTAYVYNEDGDLLFYNIYSKGTLKKTSNTDSVKYSSSPQLLDLNNCNYDFSDLKQSETCAEQALLRQLYPNLVYPTTSRNDRIEGTVDVVLEIDISGEFTILSANGPSDDLTQAALDVITTFDLFLPGMLHGIPQKSIYKLPVNFRLNN